MALIRCKECSSEVSSKAVSCPKCGAKIKRKGIGLLSVVGILFLLAAVGASVQPKQNAVSTPSTTLPLPKPKLSLKEEALSNLEITSLRWHKDEGVFMTVDAIFANNGKHDVKDIKLTCDHLSNSGTKIDSNSRNIYEVIKAGKTLKVKGFNMGLIHTQAHSSECSITDATVI
jgi:hypothetical protein